MVLKRQMSTMALELRQIVREVELLKPLKHPNIVELKEVFLSARCSRLTSLSHLWAVPAARHSVGLGTTP